MSVQIWIDGQPGIETDEAQLDRLANFGDGVFETLRVDHRGIFLAEGHKRRLLAGLQRLALNIDGDALWQQLESLLATVATQAPGLAKLVVSRAPTTLGYRTSTQPDNWRLQYSPLHIDNNNDNDTRPLQLAVPELRLARQPALAGIKHCNRLEQVLARQQLDAMAVDEGVLLDTAGDVIEACAANLFILEGDQLLTPELSQCGVAGVMREQLLQSTAQQCGLGCGEATIDLPRLMRCDGIVLCNSVRGISTVASVQAEAGQRRDWSISPELEQLQALVAAQMAGDA